MRKLAGYHVTKRFGLLFVKKYLGNRYYECICDCGKTKIVAGGNLIRGHVTSCGCLRSINRKNYDADMKNKLLAKIKYINDCWEWQGSLHRQGYGHFPYKRKILLAHRVSWNLFNGYIPENIKVCHKCDNPKCINPEHLFLGSQKENVDDMFQKKRKDHQGEKHPRAKLTKEKVLEIRQMIEKGISQEIICKKYNITNGHVGSIKHRRTWKVV